MKLTRRQKDFITNLIDLSNEVEGPIHYSTLAERLGVSPFTAYDMLRLLEEKGLVTSKYQLAAGKDGPGRAERLFYPNLSPELRRILFQDQFSGRIPGREEQLQLIADRIRSSDLVDEETAEGVLARIPDFEESEISYCAEIMTIIALRLKEREGRELLMDHLPKMLPLDETSCENLALLGGFALGILAGEWVDDEEWIEKLFTYIQQYHRIVMHFNQQECDQLARALNEVFSKLADENNGG